MDKEYKAAMIRWFVLLILTVSIITSLHAESIDDEIAQYNEYVRQNPTHDHDIVKRVFSLCAMPVLYLMVLFECIMIVVGCIIGYTEERTGGKVK